MSISPANILPKPAHKDLRLVTSHTGGNSPPFYPVIYWVKRYVGKIYGSFFSMSFATGTAD